MSLPRPVLPNQFYLVTRRCTQRQFLLRPDAETNNAFTYCLIEAPPRCQTLLRNRAFVAAYKAARQAWQNAAEATFPLGTYWLRRFANVPIAQVRDLGLRVPSRKRLGLSAAPCDDGAA